MSSSKSWRLAHWRGRNLGVDVLLSLGSVHEHSFITMTGMRNELSQMFGRDVDIVIRESLPRANPLRRQAIESEAKVIYEVA